MATQNITALMASDMNQYLTDTFVHTKVFGMYWIISSLIIVLVLLIITRDFQRWKSLALNVSIMISLTGLQVSIVIYIIAGILLAIDLLSLEVSGNIMRGIVDRTRDIKDAWDNRESAVKRRAIEAKRSEWEIKDLIKGERTKAKELQEQIKQEIADRTKYEEEGITPKETIDYVELEKRKALKGAQVTNLKTLIDRSPNVTQTGAFKQIGMGTIEQKKKKGKYEGFDDKKNLRTVLGIKQTGLKEADYSLNLHKMFGTKHPESEKKSKLKEFMAQGMDYNTAYKKVFEFYKKKK